MSNYIATNLRSGVLISEERESIATRESALWKRETRVAITFALLQKENA